MSIAEVGTIAQGYLVPFQIYDDDWCCIMAVDIIDGIICCYYEDFSSTGYMIDNKKEEEWTLVENEIGEIYKEREFYKYLEEETEY